MKKLYLLPLFSIILPLSLQSANIIFDLGGVLLDTSYLGMVRHIGIKQILCYTLFEQKNPKNLLFKILGHLEKQFNIPKNIVAIQACDQNGNNLPQIFVEWQKGTISSSEILQATEKMLLEEPHLFSSAIECETARAIMQSIFNPDIFVQEQKIIRGSLKLVKKCIKKGHKVYVLSNWDPESFSIIRKKYHMLFDCFNGIVVSGNVGMVKPDPEIFQYLLEKYNLNPQECVFIDDQSENVAAARNAGICAIRCTRKWNGKPNIKRIKKKLKTIG